MSCASENKSYGGVRIKKKTKLKFCTDCKFKSERTFNVLRHYNRIHGPAKRCITCCDSKYFTKGDWYQHCADIHPDKRKCSIVATMKYKIKRGIVNKEEIKNEPIISCEQEMGRRKSTRIPKLKYENFCNFDDDEDETSTNFSNEAEHLEKKSKIKSEINDHRTVDINFLKIIFKGNPTLHDKILFEFLRNIDFESLKLPLL